MDVNVGQVPEGLGGGGAVGGGPVFLHRVTCSRVCTRCLVITHRPLLRRGHPRHMQRVLDAFSSSGFCDNLTATALECERLK
jgi:hypothetical protein